ncbi:unnamed protein product [Penicillium olsonii]|nr:unnamed protein product [Penicillium olsonii]
MIWSNILDRGWDNTGANGANLSFPKEFGIEDNTWLVGVINAGYLSFLSLCFYRLLTYLIDQHSLDSSGMGVKISTIPVFSAEISPASIRGGLVTSFQLWVAFGIFIGFCSNLIFYRVGDLAWRFQLGAAFAPAVPVLFLVWFCPESPRWLMKKRRYQEAFRSFCRLRNTELIAARELYYAHCQVMTERDEFAGVSLASRVWELFTVPRLRRAMISSSLIVIAQQFSGINAMAFYSSTIFAEAGYSPRDCLLASLGFGLTMFVFAIPAIYTMDTFGRRNLLLFTFPNMAWCLLAAGCCFLLPVDSNARVPLIAFFIYLFGAFYGPGTLSSSLAMNKRLTVLGIGPIPSIYFSEAFPLSHRELGAAFTICVNNIVGSVLSLSFPSILAKMTATGAFGFYAALNMLAFILIFFIIPETMYVLPEREVLYDADLNRQRTLEELDYTFGVPIHKHAHYQVRTWLPWFVKRYFLFQRSAKLEPLYKLEGF